MMRGTTSKQDAIFPDDPKSGVVVVSLILSLSLIFQVSMDTDALILPLIHRCPC